MSQNNRSSTLYFAWNHGTRHDVLFKNANTLNTRHTPPGLAKKYRKVYTQHPVTAKGQARPLRALLVRGFQELRAKLRLDKNRADAHVFTCPSLQRKLLQSPATQDQFRGVTCLSGNVYLVWQHVGTQPK